MKLTETNKKTLMITLHQKIEEYADVTSDLVLNGEIAENLTYPPNNGLTQSELKELEKLKNNKILKSALRKVFADNSAGVLFELMNLIDQTTDPDEDLGEWAGLSLIDFDEEIEENDEMLHDTFSESYWDWKEKRQNNDWQLDRN
ncbi:hypothetical protein DMA11_23655 [Marinilabiliaceae bacterium JC017]|nr:hypothetical protein DMA11_23655 [Marinilabiliaceae bacterium JC017]